MPKLDGVRRLTHLAPEDLRTYASLVAPAVRELEAALAPGVLAPRLRAGGGPDAWRPARRRWRRELRGPGRTWLLVDVRECYASITPEVAASAVSRLGAPPGVGAFLASWGGPGLPIGPAPSAVVANAVLAHVDRAVVGSGFRHLRWVDDLAVSVDGRREAIRALDTIWRALHPLGLELNESKTRMVRAGGDPPPTPSEPSGVACDDAAP